MRTNTIKSLLLTFILLCMAGCLVEAPVADETGTPSQDASTQDCYEVMRRYESLAMSNATDSITGTLVGETRECREKITDYFEQTVEYCAVFLDKEVQGPDFYTIRLLWYCDSLVSDSLYITLSSFQALSSSSSDSVWSSASNDTLVSSSSRDTIYSSSSRDSVFSSSSRDSLYSSSSRDSSYSSSSYDSLYSSSYYSSFSSSHDSNCCCQNSSAHYSSSFDTASVSSSHHYSSSDTAWVSSSHRYSSSDTVSVSSSHNYSSSYLVVSSSSADTTLVLSSSYNYSSYDTIPSSSSYYSSSADSSSVCNCTF